ncbi:MAG: fructosamine kinase family protein, partial [Alphaproteobacteria bacterium]|nr:fructosamine kinase family protein [Alphaproteobacteria bacterium]
MSLPAAITARVEATMGAPVEAAERLGGGQIATVWRVELADRRSLVVKSGRDLALEAWMLRYLKSRTRVPVPEVHQADDDLLIMAFIDNDGRLEPAAETHLGEIVASLHAIEWPRFGFERDTLIGGLPQTN